MRAWAKEGMHGFHAVAAEEMESRHGYSRGCRVYFAPIWFTTSGFGKFELLLRTSTI